MQRVHKRDFPHRANSIGVGDGVTSSPTAHCAEGVRYVFINAKSTGLVAPANLKPVLPLSHM
jgi:hypothetical protein